MKRLIACLFTVFVLLGGGERSAAAQSAGSLDGFNAWAHDFNRTFAGVVVKPVLDGVRALPDPLPTALGSAFSNLSEPVSALSHLMVGDALGATQSTARFAVNSTVGLLGMIDVATPIGLPVRKRHFSEGVCALGLAAPDQYLVVPGVGPSSVGIASTAVIVMVGSTWGLALISIEFAVASTVADLAGSAAALENAAVSAKGKGDRRYDEAVFRAYLSEIGC